MDRGRRSTVVAQAEVTGKGLPDTHSLRQRANTGNRPAYPNGTVKENLMLMPGEIALATRTCRGSPASSNRTHQPCWTSWNGYLLDEDSSPEAMMRKIRVVGIVKTEYEWGGEGMYGTDPMDHGFGLSLHGSYTIINTGLDDITPGDILAIRPPPTENGDPRSQGPQGGRGGGSAVDTRLNPLRNRPRIGTPQGKLESVIERYDPCNFSWQVAGCHAIFDRPKVSGGLKGYGLSDFFLRSNDETRNMSTLVEEAFGYSRSILAIVAKGYEMFRLNAGASQAEAQAAAAVYANSFGLFGTELTPDGLRMLNAIFGRNTFPGKNPDFENRPRPATLSAAVSLEDKYEYVTDHIFCLLNGAIGGSMAAKRARIIGTANGSAKPNGSLDVSFNIFK